MFEPFTWQLLLRATPTRVFCSLVRAASTGGRACSIEDYGTVITYTPTHVEGDLTGRIRARVSPSPEGTLVTISAADRSLVGAGAMAAQARSVASLMHELRVHYGEPAVADSA